MIFFGKLRYLVVWMGWWSVLYWKIVIFGWFVFVVVVFVIGSVIGMKNFDFNKVGLGELGYV